MFYYRFPPQLLAIHHIKKNVMKTQHPPALHTVCKVCSCSDSGEWGATDTQINQQDSLGGRGVSPFWDILVINIKVPCLSLGEISIGESWSGVCVCVVKEKDGEEGQEHM